MPGAVRGMVEFGSDPVELLRRLIRFDTSNPPGGERQCIEWIRGLLEGAGLEVRLLGRDPERPNLVCRLPGRGTAPPLLLQGTWTSSRPRASGGTIPLVATWPAARSGGAARST